MPGFGHESWAKVESGENGEMVHGAVEISTAHFKMVSEKTVKRRV